MWTLYPLFISTACRLLHQVSPTRARTFYRRTDSLAEPRLPALASLRVPTSSYSSSSFTIEKDGEMPEGAVSFPRASATPPIISTPSGASTPARVAMYEEYEVPEENSVEPIKVVRTKKKGTGKKKRTVEAS